MHHLLYVALFLVLLASSCGGEQKEEILVFTAASLTDVMVPISDRFAEQEGIKVNLSFGGSAALAQQVIRGARGDVFLFSGPGPVERLEEHGDLAPDTLVNILTNDLVLVVRASKAQDLGIFSMDDLADSDFLIAIADPDLAPAGNYAKEALQSMGLWDDLQEDLIRGFDVRVAVGYVETGNVDVGIVYRTDATTSNNLTIVGSVPMEAHSPIAYPAGIVEGTDHSQAARRFLMYLQGETAKGVFREYGFVPYVDGS